jgi:5-methylcytosine-specific restriction protein A
MPNAPKKFCGTNGCMAIVEQGTKCPKHRGGKGTSRNRPGDPFYASARWRALRQAKLLDSPLCECDDCKRTGAVVAADTVDHIQPRAERPDLELSYENLRSMSAAHHNRRTRRHLNRKRQNKV